MIEWEAAPRRREDHDGAAHGRTATAGCCSQWVTAWKRTLLDRSCGTGISIPHFWRVRRSNLCCCCCSSCLRRRLDPSAWCRRFVRGVMKVVKWVSYEGGWQLAAVALLILPLQIICLPCTSTLSLSFFLSLLNTNKPMWMWRNCGRLSTVCICHGLWCPLCHCGV